MFSTLQLIAILIIVAAATAGYFYITSQSPAASAAGSQVSAAVAQRIMGSQVYKDLSSSSSLSMSTFSQILSGSAHSDANMYAISYSGFISISEKGGILGLVPLKFNFDANVEKYYNASRIAIYVKQVPIVGNFNFTLITNNKSVTMCLPSINGTSFSGVQCESLLSSTISNESAIANLTVNATSNNSIISQLNETPILKILNLSPAQFHNNDCVALNGSFAFSGNSLSSIPENGISSIGIQQSTFNNSTIQGKAYACISSIYNVPLTVMLNTSAALGSSSFSIRANMSETSISNTTTLQQVTALPTR